MAEATTESNETEETEAAQPSQSLRFGRVLAIALPLIVLDSFWVIQAERVGSGPYFTTISLFANVLFLFTLLLGINALVRRWLPRVALRQSELLLIYAMIGVGAAIGSQDFLTGIVQMIGHPYHFGSRGFLEHFGQYLPPALVVQDKTALDAFYSGHSSLYQPENYGPWLRPAALWTGFIVALFWTMQCLNVLVRQGWQERERLSFPVVEIPLQMAEPSGSLWRNRLFWIGFGLCALVEIVNGLASLYPSVPQFNTGYVDLTGSGIFATRPFNRLDFVAYSFYPFAIGLGYLLPLDLLFSTWFFYFFWKAQLLATAIFGFDTKPDVPFIKEQAFGSFFAILFFMFWNGREYFRLVARKILKEPSDIDDSGEGLSYRVALIGALVGFVALVGFMAWAGLSPLLAVIAFAIYFAISLTVTRIRAELGPPVHDLHFSGPDSILTHTFGSASFSGRDLTVLNFFYSFNRAYRSHPQPIAIEGMKATKQTGGNQRVVFWGLMIAAVVGTISFFWAYLHLAFSLGAQAKFLSGSSYGAEAYNRLNGWIQQRTPPDAGVGAAIVFGFLFCVLLFIARSRFPWWPFHPIGFAISSSWAINLVWMPLLIAWIVKGLFLRYGGVRLYRQMMPFFIGLILGQMLTGSLWHLIGWVLGVAPYSFWGG